MKDLIWNRWTLARVSWVCCAAVVLIHGWSGSSPLVAEEMAAEAEIEALEQQLRETETAFATAFAEGDIEAFSRLLDENAVFMGRSTPLRGKENITERWKQMRGTGEAPFSWRPERVAVEAGGRFGMSTGPVMAPDGTWLSSFVSTWKRTPEGWRVILDVGPRCPPPPPSSSAEE